MDTERSRLKIVNTLLLFLLAALGALGQQNSTPFRLALVAADSAPAAVADLLMVELSHQRGVQLLERAEISRIFREQQLSTAGPDMLKLGKLLGADGLLVLESGPEGTNQLARARLIAVKPGVVIADERVPFPKDHEAESVKTLVSQLQPMFSKLAVKPGDAVPLSVLNLRAAVRAPGDQSLEHELTLLLIHRLTRERDFFVLERRRLGDVLFEKALQPDDASPFWTGRYLLDGSFEQDGSAPDAITLHIRLVSPQGGVTNALQVTGSRMNLNALVEKLVGQVLAALKKDSGPGSWQPLAEAEQFAAEARWALRWRLLPEAQAAVESAWALGKQDKDTAILRVHSYMDGKSVDDWIYGGTVAD
jgi:hypothetical protein